MLALNEMSEPYIGWTSLIFAWNLSFCLNAESVLGVELLTQPVTHFVSIQISLDWINNFYIFTYQCREIFLFQCFAFNSTN